MLDAADPGPQRRSPIAPEERDDAEMAVVELPQDSNPPAGAVDWEDPASLPVGAVEDLFLTLSKALRSYQLYDRNTPVYRRFLANLREAFQTVWADRDELEILVDEDRFLWMGQDVYREDNRSSSLSFLLYRDGIRELTFRKGIEDDEMEVLLDVLQRVRASRSSEDDLVTLLWDLDLSFLEYGAVDLLPEGTLLRSQPSSDERFDVGEILTGEFGTEAPSQEELAATLDGDEGAEAPTGAIRPEDFNPTLYALDEGERSYVEQLYRAELKRDLRLDVLNALFDRLEDSNTDTGRQKEIVSALRQLLPTFLAQGALSHSARLLQEVEERLKLDVPLAPEASEQIRTLLDEFSSPDAVRELVHALEDGAIPEDGEELGLLLRHLKPSALGPLLARIEEVTRPEARRTLRTATRTLARGEEDRIATFLSDPDPVVVAGAVRLLGGLRHKASVPTLVELLRSGSPVVQGAVLDAARRLPTTALAEELERTLFQDERDLRVGAARVLAEVKYIPAKDTLGRILEGKEFKEADLTEKMAFFEAYADLAGPDGVALLSRVLNHRSLLGRRELPELRACAALALGRIEDPTAVQALERARDDSEPAVRSAVNRVLSRGNREEGEG